MKRKRTPAEPDPREKVGLMQALPYGQLEAMVRPAAVIGEVVGTMLARLVAEGCELDTVSVVATPESHLVEQEHGPDVLVIRASGIRDRVIIA